MTMSWIQSCACSDFRVLFACLGFNATFNNILVISLQSVLLVEEAGVPGENHRPWAGNWKTFSHVMRVKRNPLLYGTNPGVNSCLIGDRIQWSVQVSLNQLPRPLCHPGPHTQKLRYYTYMTIVGKYRNGIFHYKFPELSVTGVEGGFNVDDKQFEFEETHSIVVLPEWTTIPLPCQDIPDMVL